MSAITVDWAPRVKQTRIRRLYRSARLGVYDDEALEDVGSALYARCTDIAAVADAFRYGRVPCPQCREPVQRAIDPLFGLEGHGRYNHWFECPECAQRLLWADCRAALLAQPRCFDCQSLLKGKKVLRCACGKKWDRKAYDRSVKTRVRLPCPHCQETIRKPLPPESGEEAEDHPSSREVECPKCQGIALHANGNIECGACGYKRRWRDYRRGLKRRDEKLACTACGHDFKWQAWRKSTKGLGTGNPQPARDFIERWPRCRTAKTRMMQIDFLLQTLHGRGPLAPVFIEGDEHSVRKLLDELAAQV